jgi:hypothetical protein
VAPSIGNLAEFCEKLDYTERTGDGELDDCQANARRMLSTRYGKQQMPDLYCSHRAGGLLCRPSRDRAAAGNRNRVFFCRACGRDARLRRNGRHRLGLNAWETRRLSRGLGYEHQTNGRRIESETSLPLNCHWFSHQQLGRFCKEANYSVIRP